ncbi:hypothetical protein WBG99_07920 [Streptomyces sp. TG1A-60]|uniref:hypothetical protein n=1 Tax=Streptomyces sp. TG1A-60 TaxID=3129111 RepID=UPI0030CAD837
MPDPRRLFDAAERRLYLLRITAPARLTEPGVDVAAASAVVHGASAAVGDRVLGCALLIAGKVPRGA